MAQTFLSPGVQVTEVDNTLTAKTVGISTGAAVLTAGWGPTMIPTLIDSENTLVNIFGQPNDNNYKTWFTAANFLAYTDSCYVVRMATDNQFNANGKGLTGWRNEQFTNSKGQQVDVVDEDGDPVRTRVGLVINNDTEYSSRYESGAGDYGEFAAKYPGSLGNSLMVTYADAKTFNDWSWTDSNGTVHNWFEEFSSAPGTSKFARARDGENDEIHLLVVDAGGRITGTKGTILEKYQFLSKSCDAKSLDGVSNSYVKVLKEQSEYVYWMDYPTADQLVPNYDSKIVAIVDSEESETKLITDKKVKVGDKIINSTDKVVKVATIEVQISDEGVKSKVLKFVEYKQLIELKGQRFLNATEQKSYAIDISAQSGDPTITEIKLEDGAKWGTSVVDNEFASLKAPVTVELSGGTDDFDYSDANEIQAWDLFANKEVYDIGLIACGPATATVSKYVVQNICEPRMDCVAFISPVADGRGPILGTLTDDDISSGLTSTEVNLMNKTIKWRTDSSFNLSSSYGHLDSGWKYQYDKYNDVNRWVPLNGDCAGIYARTDSTNDPWWSGAGYTRGQVKNVIKLSYSPNKSHRDQLYQQGINSVVTFVGEGTILYGDKTLQTKPSAFDRINVRRLFIYVEKVLAATSKYVLFEFNDEITRSYVKNLFDPILRQIQGKRGIIQFFTNCSESNNNADIVEANKLVVDVYIQPARSINFISINCVASKESNMVFSESES